MGLVQSITQAIAKEFQQDTGKAQVTVGISGTSGGFESSVPDKQTSNASRPILRLSYLTYQFFLKKGIFLWIENLHVVSLGDHYFPPGSAGDERSHWINHRLLRSCWLLPRMCFRCSWMKRFCVGRRYM